MENDQVNGNLDGESDDSNAKQSCSENGSCSIDQQSAKRLCTGGRKSFYILFNIYSLIVFMLFEHFRSN